VNQTLQELSLASCKVGDEGAVAVVAAIGNNDHTVLRKLKMRDNYISANAGDIVVDALGRNRS